MGRQDFGREPFAVDDRDTIYLPSIPDSPAMQRDEGPHIEPISTSVLANADRTRKTHFGYDEERLEIQLLAYFNKITLSEMNLCVKTLKEMHPEATCMAITLASSSASEHLKLFESAGFRRDVTRDEIGVFTFTRSLKVEKLEPPKKATTEPLTYAAIADQYVADGLVVPASIRRELEIEQEMLALRKKYKIGE